MIYNKGYNDFKNFIVAEDKFDARYLGKCETIMALGNGYMGIRSSMEERYVGEVRDTFVSGTFNKFHDNEVTELPNVADVTGMIIYIDNEKLNLTESKIIDYERTLNLRTGELTRKFTYECINGNRIQMVFNRFVSIIDKHVIGQKITIIPEIKDVEINIQSGINGQVTNFGVQHFAEGEKRLYDNKFLQMMETTTQSKIDFAVNTVHKFSISGKEYEPVSHVYMDRRKIGKDYNLSVKKDDKLCIEKISNIYTSRDKENEGLDIDGLKKVSYEKIKESYTKGYDSLIETSMNGWKAIWDKNDIIIKSQDDFDQLAIRFAIYHLVIMTPAHDNRMSIAAKGLTGEGYKGHTFWDTEVFILPYFIYSNPKIARSLLEYRYNTLPGAHKKAKANGYEGAMFPWESAWLEDGEVTPVWGGADIITGKSTKIWSGFIEQHISADVAFATWQYYQITDDDDFMNRYGYELFMDTAKFWSSRLEYNEQTKEYNIKDVIGPDEYKEHVNNNAFTNYMAYWNIKTAIYYYDKLKEDSPSIYNRLNEKLKLDKVYRLWKNKVDKIYLPKPNKDLIIPQDDEYLKKKIIDLTKYKNQKNVGEIFRDYNLEQVNQIQVSKQADIMALFYLLEDLFGKEIKTANYNYYEPKTLHDSSLSLSTHCVLANDLGDNHKAYNLFSCASRIDLGENMTTSDHGIHAASIGGIWQCVVNGFGGVRMLGGNLRIEPNLPDNWSEVKFPIYWHQDRLMITVTKYKLEIENLSKDNKQIVFINKGKEHILKNKICLNIN
ncbi:glycosyl hydrolase family 65 [Vallitalea longa]|uniref:Glycosyl hydrolase family 65 n=1 Tax=Vallitalea longa TaxID=2936439 RepID=A0A9W5YE52_9FIRM|nr:glycosyl hydrolase family 65 protein [Vallitalea longa]GKX30279.1 glycosyl hydrolase family 65 [Vallitalea longa]